VTTAYFIGGTWDGHAADLAHAPEVLQRVQRASESAEEALARVESPDGAEPVKVRNELYRRQLWSATDPASPTARFFIYALDGLSAARVFELLLSSYLGMVRVAVTPVSQLPETLGEERATLLVNLEFTPTGWVGLHARREEVDGARAAVRGGRGHLPP
jgi:hypothetical protein